MNTPLLTALRLGSLLTKHNFYPKFVVCCPQIGIRQFATITRFLKLKRFKLRKMSEQIKWVCCSEVGKNPPGAVEGGFDNGSKLLVIRAQHDNDLLPGKFHVGFDTAYVPLAGQEFEMDFFEVLIAPIGSLRWKICEACEIPTNAIAGGMSAAGETLYIGRVHHMGTLTIGKVHPSHVCCYIPYDGKELAFQNFEILVANCE